MGSCCGKINKISTFSDLFYAVMEKSEQLRHSGQEKFDGQGFWQPIKKELKQYDNYLVEWSPQVYDETVMALDDNVPVQHFRRQLDRIPLEEDPNPRKVIQLALNIGQFLGSVKDDATTKFDISEMKEITFFVRTVDPFNGIIKQSSFDIIANYLEIY